MKSALQQRQHQLMDYLLSGNGDIAEHVLTQGNVDTKTRLHIYRNAYQVRLGETIDSDHPATGVYLGDKLFELMVSEYRQQHASSHRSLRRFANELPSFLATQAPFSDNPQISELARFERLLMSAFDAADAPRVTRQQLAQLPAEHWPIMELVFHPSVLLFESHWNAVEIWQAIKEEQPPPVAQQGSVAWLLWRNEDLLTEFRHLGAAELAMFKLFSSGENFAAACEALLDIEAEDQISATAINILMGWLDSGLLQAINTTNSSNQ